MLMLKGSAIMNDNQKEVKPERAEKKRFTKAQIINSRAFEEHERILKTFLQEDTTYTIDDINKLIVNTTKNKKG